jgi:hypothetical protein
MKNKIKFKKHKTETSNLLDKLNASGIKQKNTFKYAPFFHHIYSPQPNFFLQQPTKPSSIRNYFAPFPQIENEYEWQNRLN